MLPPDGRPLLDEVALRGLVGQPVVDVNGRGVGCVEAVFDGSETGRPEWIGVQTGAIRQQHVLVPVVGAERDSPALRVPWTRGWLKRAPRYDRSDRHGALGLGEYRVVISRTKEREARVYYKIAEVAVGADRH